MPAVRLRRRSSLSNGFGSIRSGRYDLSSSISLSPQRLTFAPNITPGSYNEPDRVERNAQLIDALFAPSEEPAPGPSRRRAPPGKRLSQGYIPRPANAFMLFRADFVRQKHVPGSIETNHGSLSKIIGQCWRALPLEEKAIWEELARTAKAEHREKYPNYRFRPVHNKEKKAAKAARRKDKLPVPEEDERRCEEVAQLLLEGKKGDELAAAVRQLDIHRTRTPAASPGASSSQHHEPIPDFFHRRSSSVPAPITLPTVPFFAGPYAQPSRAPSLVRNISRTQRAVTNQRRASSAQPTGSRSWSMPLDASGHVATPEPWQLQRDFSPLPEPDMSLFQPQFSFPPPSSSFASNEPPKDYNYSPYAPGHPFESLSLSIDPLTTVSPLDMSALREQPYSALSSAPSPASAYPYSQDMMQLGPLDPSPAWMPQSGPPSALSGSPAMSDHSLPAGAPQGYGDAQSQNQGYGGMAADLYAPQPMYAPSQEQPFAGWAQGAQMSPQALHLQMQTNFDAPAQAQAQAQAFSYSQYDNGLFADGFTNGYSFADDSAMQGY